MIFRRIIYNLLLLSLCCLSSCGEDDKVDTSIPDHEGFYWSKGESYSGIGALNHDDRILHTPHFVIFSNNVSDENRIILGEILEESFEEVKTVFGVSEDAPLNSLNAQIAVDIENGYLGLSETLSLYLGAPIFSNVEDPSTRYQAKGLIKHEVTHMFELHLGGLVNRTHRWFWEGVAVYTAGNYKFRTLQQVNDWRDLVTGGNPISVKNQCGQPQECGDFGFDYYPMFGLTLAYLLDPNGLNKEYVNISNLYSALKSGSNFEQAFLQQFGMKVDDLESNYFDIFELYLE